MKKIMTASAVFLITLCCLILPDQNSAARDNTYTTIKNIEM